MDELLELATQLVIAAQYVTPLMLERKMKIKRADALWLIDQLEANGTISAPITRADGTSYRDVLVDLKGKHR